MARDDKLKIIYEDEDLLICHKRAGLATQTKKLTEADLCRQVMAYLGKDAFVGLIHRLDQPVEGIVMFAKSKKAAGILSKSINEASMGKYYLALVEGRPESAVGEKILLSDYLLKDGRSNLSKVVKEGTTGAKLSKLEYELLDSYEREDGVVSLLSVHLLTGRHHQIRLQLSHAGFPIVGDKKYGNGSMKAGGFPALCAERLVFRHPITNSLMDIKTKPENGIFSLT